MRSSSIPMRRAARKAQRSSISHVSLGRARRHPSSCRMLAMPTLYAARRRTSPVAIVIITIEPVSFSLSVCLLSCVSMLARDALLSAALASPLPMPCLEWYNRRPRENDEPCHCAVAFFRAACLVIVFFSCNTQAYTAWVNSQLRKRPELPLINDMGNDLQDGVLVAKLIEIISELPPRGVPSFFLLRRAPGPSIIAVVMLMSVDHERAARANTPNVLTFHETDSLPTSSFSTLSSFFFFCGVCSCSSDH